jgi:tetratricopeptide (TPR) repeat protein
MDQPLTPPAHRRNIEPEPAVRFRPAGHRWAIIIGISKYANPALDLKFAHRDAVELHELLQTDSGGGFELERMRKLVDAEATTANITRALRSFLIGPEPEDIVFIFLACHGSPDPRRPSNIYFLTHDTDINDIAGTALPMRELDLSLRENLLAERVVILADTCHSAAIGRAVGARGAGNDGEIINAYLDEMSKAKGGVALLTSAAANESAFEGEQWGGHGVFTHFLLRGLRGEADGYEGPKDGKVTVGELFEYVRDQVKRATSDAQHPTIGASSFDRNLPLAITGGIDARERLALGVHLHDLARLEDDPRRFDAAALQLREAVELARASRLQLPKAELALGRALLGAGRVETAREVLTDLTRRVPDAPAEAHLYLALAQPRPAGHEQAAQALERFVRDAPHDRRAAWASACAARLRNQPGRAGRRFALLVGINEYQSDRVSKLQGCVNDAHMLAGALAGRCGFAAEDVELLCDAAATRAAFVQALERLAVRATPDDCVVIGFSGHSLQDLGDRAQAPAPTTYLIFHDTEPGEGTKIDATHELAEKLPAIGGVGPAELHRLMSAIPTRRKLLVLDTHPSVKLNQLVEDADDYALIVASDGAEQAAEIRVPGGEGKMSGALSAALVAALADIDPQCATYGSLVAATVAQLRRLRVAQTPLFVGDRRRLVLGDDELWNLFELAQRRSLRDLSLETLRRRYAAFCQHATFPFADVDLAFGRELLARAQPQEAAVAFERAFAAQPKLAEALLGLGAARLELGDDHATMAAWQRHIDLVADEDKPRARELVEVARERHQRGGAHALLVGIDDYAEQGLDSPAGAVADVLAFRQVLTARLGFADAHVKVLVDREATSAAVLAAFGDLVQRARQDPALFFFAGNGSKESGSERPTLVCADSRLGTVRDLPIAELAARARGAEHLVSILDAGWSLARGRPRARTAPSDAGGAAPGVARDLVMPRPPRVELDEAETEPWRIGPFTIVNQDGISPPGPYHADLESRGPSLLSASQTATNGLLSRDLLTRVQSSTARPRFRDWLDPDGATSGLLVLGKIPDERVFDTACALRCSLRAFEHRWLDDTILLLKRLIEERVAQGHLCAAEQVSLGVALAAIGEHDRSITPLQKAVAALKQVGQTPDAGSLEHEAHYRLGRTLYELGSDLTAAVSELKAAVQSDPDNAFAHYYLGQATRAMVERETLAKAEDAFRSYVALGAPLGAEDEIRAFLRSRGRKPTR